MSSRCLSEECLGQRGRKETAKNKDSHNALYEHLGINYRVTPTVDTQQHADPFHPKNMKVIHPVTINPQSMAGQGSAD